LLAASCARAAPSTSDERRARVLAAVKRHFDDAFDDPISDFRANGLLDLFVRELGATVDNQGVRDACGYVQDKLADLDGEIHEPEPR
jgi:uncharacterized protein (DUF2164 family)